MTTTEYNGKKAIAGGLKNFDDLDFTDNFMFCKVMELYPDICKQVTEVITGRKIRTIVQSQAQKTIEITDGNRGVRFDGYFEDDEDNMYDVEMQAYREESPLLRSRYYQSMNDLACLERGDPFTNLKESYIIFIGLQDFFSAGLSCYRFEKICSDLPGVNDGTHTIFVNASGFLNEQSEGYANLIAYLKEPLPTDSLTRDIAAAIEVLRDRRDLRREYVTFQEIIDKEKEISFKEGDQRGEARGVAKGVAETLQKISVALNIPEAELREMIDAK